MRIGAGKYRGRPIRAPRGRQTRPTRARVRRSLFDRLAPALAGAVVWDLFAGTGALGLEALSRGAREVFFVEREPRALRVLQQNVAALEAGDRARVRGMDVFAFLQLALRRGLRADVALADPAYEGLAARRCWEFLCAHPEMAPLVALEHSSRSPLPPPGEGWAVRSWRQGETAVTVASFARGKG